MKTKLRDFRLNFIKKILQLPFNTPGYAVRLETGNRRLIFICFRLALSFIEKMLAMDNS